MLEIVEQMDEIMPSIASDSFNILLIPVIIMDVPLDEITNSKVINRFLITNFNIGLIREIRKRERKLCFVNFM